MGESDHALDDGKRKAKLIRASTYRENGYHHIRATPSRLEIYNSADKLESIKVVLRRRRTRPKPPTVDPASDGHARRYTFTYQSNFKLGGAPYPNDGHHLIPVNAFSEKFFTSDQLKLLWMVPYDVNNKENILFLPERRRDSEFHLLPSHSGDHPRYTKLVVEDMKDVRDSLTEVIKKDPDHKSWVPPNDIPGQLMQIQADYWKHLVNSGPGKVNELKKPTARARIGR